MRQLAVPVGCCRPQTRLLRCTKRSRRPAAWPLIPRADSACCLCLAQNQWSNFQLLQDNQMVDSATLGADTLSADQNDEEVSTKVYCAGLLIACM